MLTDGMWRQSGFQNFEQRPCSLLVGIARSFASHTIGVIPARPNQAKQRMEDNEGAHGLPSSLSAVFDSSDDDDLLNTQATQTALDKDDSANGLQCTAQDRQDDLLRSQLLRLSDEYRQAGQTVLLCRHSLQILGAPVAQIRLQFTGEQLQEQLSCLGLSTTQLSPAAASDLQCIAAAAQALRLQGCQSSAFLLALSQLRTQESQLACAQVYVCLCSHKGTLTPMQFPQKICSAMQHESQELATWLAHRQSSTVQQLKKLRSALDSAQSQAIPATDQTNGYHSNIAMLAQKEQQYTHQLQVLEEKLASVQYSPLVSSLLLFQRLSIQLQEAHSRH